MQYKKYECNTFNVHTIKTDKFKNCIVNIIFRKNIKKEEITKFNFLVDMITMSSEKYPTRRDVVLELENLYNASFRAITNRVGNSFNIDFITSFIDPKYCDEGYLEEVLNFGLDMINNPNVKNDEFDKRCYNIEKSRLEAEITSLKENGPRYAMRNCCIAVDDESPISYNMSGYMEDLEKITPSNLYDAYKQMLKEFICDVYVIGNLDMDEVVSIFKKNFKLNTVKDYEIPLYADCKLKNKTTVLKEVGNYKQASLVMAYNVCDLTKREADVVIHIYNMILGAGGLNSKLSKSLREENSLCYSCKSMYNRFDKTIFVYAGIDENSYDLSVKLVKKAFKDMASGKISSEDLENNKLQLISSVKVGQDMPSSILNNYVFHTLADIPLFEDRIELIKSVTIDEVIEVAKKVKLNTIYLLSSGGED